MNLQVSLIILRTEAKIRMFAIIDTLSSGIIFLNWQSFWKLKLLFVAFIVLEIMLNTKEFEYFSSQVPVQDQIFFALEV